MKDDFSIKGEVISALEEIDDPEKGKNLIDAHMIENVEVDGGVVDIILEVEPGRDREERFAIEDGIYDNVEAIGGVREVKIKTMTPKAIQRDAEGGDEEAAQQDQPSGQASGGADQSPAAAGGAQGPASAPGQGAAAGPASGAQSPSVPDAEELEGVGQVIAVASGKGGVGKSTVAVNLALALQEQGHRVGLLDTDIYGPSLPTLLGIQGRPSVSDRRIVPLQAHGLSVMSLGFLMDDDTPVIWRGPIVTGIIRQFLRDVDWSGLDYLIVDMPPGTGDAQLALAQTVPVDGAVVVSTPSELSLIDAARGFEMFNTLNVDVMGVVSNMSNYKCPECGHEEHIFGGGGLDEEIERLETRLLADIPLDPDVRKGGDEGAPIVVSKPESHTTEAFLDLADSVAGLKPPHGGDEDDEASGEGEKEGLFSFLKE
jgi:ATP-binding protein involved in chromosome partitioning